MINIQPSNFVEIPLKIITFSPIGWPIFTFFFQKLTATFKKSPFYTTWEQQEIMYFSVKKKHENTVTAGEKSVFGLSFFAKISRSNFKILFFLLKKIQIGIIGAVVSSKKLTKKNTFRKNLKVKWGGVWVSRHAQIGIIGAVDKNPLF